MALCLLGGGFFVFLHADTLPGRLTVEDVYGGSDFSAKSIASMQWAEDKNVLYSVEGRSLIETDASSGKTRLIAEVPVEIQGYSFSQDKSKLLIFTNSKRVWRSNTKGDWWVLNLKTANFRQLGLGFESSEMMFAKFSPKGDRVAYVYKNNIYVEDARLLSLLDICPIFHITTVTMLLNFLCFSCPVHHSRSRMNKIAHSRETIEENLINDQLTEA